MCPICTTTRSSGVQFLSDHSWANLLPSLPHKFANPMQHESFLSFSTDEPKPPGPVELEHVVYGKVIITWTPSPDQKKDDQLYYLVDERDSNTRVWRTIADRLFCSRYCTVYTASVQSSREYHSMQKIIWDFLIHLNHQRGVLTNWEVGCWREQTSAHFIQLSNQIFFFYHHSISP